MKVGDTIYFLSDYVWTEAELLSIGPKNLKLQISPGFGLCAHVTRVSKEKCALPDEKVAIIWEMWKGTNGRGGYRVERKLYADQRIKAENISHKHLSLPGSGRIDEETEI